MSLLWFTGYQSPRLSTVSFADPYGTRPLTSHLGSPLPAPLPKGVSPLETAVPYARLMAAFLCFLENNFRPRSALASPCWLAGFCLSLDLRLCSFPPLPRGQVMDYSWFLNLWPAERFSSFTSRASSASFGLFFRRAGTGRVRISA